PVGSGTLDRLALPTGVIVDLIGNVGEYVRDTWERLVEPCWARSGLYGDPLCLTASTLDPPPTLNMRGGEWNLTPHRSSGRYYTTGASPLRGFRCARAVAAQ